MEKQYYQKVFKGWNKPFANSITNVSLFILFAFIAHILYLFLPDNGEIYSISFFLNKFLFAEISALIIASLLITNRTLNQNREAISKLQIENKKI
jgi:hypothetical protein